MLQRRKPLQAWGLDVDRAPAGAEFLGQPCGAAHQTFRAGAWADAGEQAHAGLPYRRIILVAALGQHVVADALRRAAQGQFAQCHQVALAQGCRLAFGCAYLAGLETRQHFIDRYIDQDHLVRVVEQGIGHGVACSRAGDVADHVA